MRTINPDLRRFRSYYIVDSNGCFLWTGALNNGGYGQFWANGKNIRAHKFAWLASGRRIPENLYLCHTCDIPRCVNINHLFLGTAKQNTQDSLEKGRWAVGARHSTRTNPNHALTKINMTKARRMRKLKDKGFKVKDIAAAFGLSYQGAYKVLVGARW